MLSFIHGVFCCRDLITYFLPPCLSITPVPKKGRKKSLTLGQVGIGCSHCRNSETKLKGCTYFPSSISGIYNATMIIQQRHFPVCPSVSKETLEIHNKLKVLTARSASTKEYWVWAAKKLVSVGTHCLCFHCQYSPHTRYLVSYFSRASSIQMKEYSSTSRRNWQTNLSSNPRLLAQKSFVLWWNHRIKSLRPNMPTTC